jgi:hypothetical protein
MSESAWVAAQRGVRYGPCDACHSLPSWSGIREILDPVLHIVRIENLGNQLQIANGSANGNTELVSVHDASESRACLQTPDARLLTDLGLG